MTTNSATNTYRSRSSAPVANPAPVIIWRKKGPSDKTLRAGLKRCVSRPSCERIIYNQPHRTWGGLEGPGPNGFCLHWTGEYQGNFTHYLTVKPPAGVSRSSSLSCHLAAVNQTWSNHDVHARASVGADMLLTSADHRVSLWTCPLSPACQASFSGGRHAHLKRFLPFLTEIITTLKTALRALDYPVQARRTQARSKSRGLCWIWATDPPADNRSTAQHCPDLIGPLLEVSVVFRLQGALRVGEPISFHKDAGWLQISASKPRYSTEGMYVLGTLGTTADLREVGTTGRSLKTRIREKPPGALNLSAWKRDHNSPNLTTAS
ncbi:hypothetical protein RRG08_027871 [Elysia crispata]|uniref:Uncharacterized protein n=1 Tax=Elysia crispata TaxID=231223 RepID=A0AAE1DUS4_9GAST|nr:hypothetical protein RRG08_027871 [Elysia crispata]